MHCAFQDVTCEACRKHDGCSVYETVRHLEQVVIESKKIVEPVKNVESPKVVFVPRTRKGEDVI